MDSTRWVADLFATVPVHATLGLVVRRAEAGHGEVSAVVRPELGNVVGAMHSSGIAALVDASGLAAALSWCPDPEAFAGIVPLGRAARLEFEAPGRGTLLARTTLDRDAAAPLLDLLGDPDLDRARFATETEVSDEAGTVVARGGFDWVFRRG